MTDEVNPVSEQRSDEIQRVEVLDSLPVGVVIRLFVIGTSIVVFAVVSVFGFFVYTEARARNDLIYRNCVSNELQDSEIVKQLDAAKKRLVAQIPNPLDPVRIEQEEILNDGIRALEPGNPPGSEERDCFPPDTLWPW